MDMLQKIDIHFWGEDLPFYFKRPSVRKTREVDNILNKIKQIDSNELQDDNKFNLLDNAIKACVDFINNTLVIGRDRQVKACSIIFETDDYEMYDISEIIDIVEQITDFMNKLNIDIPDDTDNLILNS